MLMIYPDQGVSGEQVEGIMHAASSLSSLLVLLHAIVAVLIVDFPELRVYEHVVGLGDFDEFLVG